MWGGEKLWLFSGVSFILLPNGSIYKTECANPKQTFIPVHQLAGQKHAFLAMCMGLKSALFVNLQEQRDLASTEAAMVSQAIKESVRELSSPEVIDRSENDSW